MGTGMGVLPDFRATTFGFTAAHRTFTSTHPVLFTDEVPIVGEDRFLTMEAMARITLFKGVQLQAHVPYNVYSQKENNVFEQRSGLGDIRAGLNYQFSGGESLRYQIAFGAGVKLPTGRWNEPEVNVNLMPGTGSTDFYGAFNALLRLRDWGLMLQSSGSRTGENKEHFRFGNHAEGMIRAMRWLTLTEELSVIAHVGYSASFLDPNLLRSEEVELTGGMLSQFRPGIDVYYSNWGVQSQVGIPLKQNLAEGHVVQESWMSFSLIYFITK
ncbi:MAG: hypothetical protein RL226_1570 [Bacteroidota bacterium]